ncbi:MAG: glycoside hydrolase family 2 protein [Dehalococcoidales bacterium]|jgi:beta-mannosidase
MRTIDLSGQWRLRPSGKKELIRATVPGCVHTDLLAAGKIPPPFHRDNESELQWIGETDWLYTREFVVPADFLQHERVLLRCEGLDTFAVITVNAKEIARTDNMFRTWEFDVKHALQPGKNRIQVRFNSTIPYIKKHEKERRLPAWKGPLDVPGGGWVRKEPCNYGWDWGPVLVTCGIWRAIKLIAFNTARIGDVRLGQRRLKDGGVALDVTAAIESLGKDAVTAVVTVSHGKQILQAAAPFKRGRARVTFNIKKPALWWPNGMGRQPLYNVTVNVLNKDGFTLDSVAKRIGLRTLKLWRKKDKWGESFGFAVNGVPFFAKGANWIPADAFAPRLTRQDYADLLQSAAAVNMNMLRVWGGGIYEDDVFYDLCDELGICVWQDFMFACSAYPAFDPAFLENVRREAEDNIRRLRHHACLALWCGNNELETGLLADKWDAAHMSWEDYSKLFDVLLPDIVKRLNPARDYWPCSPHVPHGDRMKFADDRWGDAHLWAVWHSKQPFEWYRTSRHRFASEFGFQSFPEPRTVYAYTAPADRNITSYVMEHHQRSDIGNTAIMTYMLDWFRLPRDFDSTLWLSQVLQGVGMQYAIEHWRRIMPRSMGALYWQLNDCWPVAGWSSIDYHHRWKALHYLARRFYAPVLVSGLEDAKKGVIDIYITSDLLESSAGVLSWRVTDVKGRTLLRGKKSVVIASRLSRRVHVLKLADLVKTHTTRDLLIWVELAVRGKVVSSNLISFARPKHLEMVPPDITARARREKGGSTTVTLTAKAPALWVWLELEGEDARFSDSFFHLRPGRPVKIAVHTENPLSLEDISRRLRVRSLVDTY